VKGRYIGRTQPVLPSIRTNGVWLGGGKPGCFNMGFGKWKKKNRDGFRSTETGGISVSIRLVEKVVMTVALEDNRYPEERFCMENGCGSEQFWGVTFWSGETRMRT